MLFFSATLLSFGGACYELGRAVFDGRRVLERLRSSTATAVFSAWGLGSIYMAVIVVWSGIVGPPEI